MSFGLSGGFWPTSFPLFQASHLLTVSMIGVLCSDYAGMVAVEAGGLRGVSTLCGIRGTTAGYRVEQPFLTTDHRQVLSLILSST